MKSIFKKKNRKERGDNWKSGDKKKRKKEGTEEKEGRKKMFDASGVF